MKLPNIRSLTQPQSPAFLMGHPKQSLPALTSLRFVAAMGVVFFHYLPRDATASSPAIRIINHGYVGVSFFFVLSGFILAYNYADSDLTSWNALRRYYSRRIARIYPALALATLVHLPLFYYGLAHKLPGLDATIRGSAVTVLTFSMLQSWVPFALGELNAPSWTISVEMFLYASFPMAVLAIRRLSFGRQLPVVLLLACLCWVPSLFAEPPNDRALLAELPLWARSPYPLFKTWIATFPLFHLPQFVLGVVASLWVSQPNAVRLPIATARIALFVIAACVFLILALPSSFSRSLEAAINHGALAPLFAAAFSVFALARESVIPLLNLRWLIVLGEASYPIYILQMPVMSWCQIIVKRSPFFASQPMFAFFLCLGILIWLSLIVWRWEHAVRPHMVVWLEKRWPLAPRVKSRSAP